MNAKSSLACLFFSGFFLFLPAAYAAPLVLPDNGGGTVNLPILGNYVNDPLYLGGNQMHIINGLPGGSQINIDVVHYAPLVTDEQVGGSLGGTKSGGGGSPLFQFSMQGVGAFSGYSRILNMPGTNNVLSFVANPPLFGTPAPYEVHAAPRTPFAPIQSFTTDMFGMFSQIFGDPDFDLLRVTAGSNYGLPSPGQTILTQLPGNQWNVDSFFDVTYRIDFVGKPGGPFSGMSGSTTGTVRIEVGETIVPEPSTWAIGALTTLGLSVAGLRRRRAM